MHHFLREINTLPYLNKDIVIGDRLIKNDPFMIFKNLYRFYQKKYGQRKSIGWNRVQLMTFLFLSHLFQRVYNLLL